MTSPQPEASTSRGTKRHCLNCTLPFYDLARSPIVCPNCGEHFELHVRLSSSPLSRSTAEKGTSANVIGRSGADQPAAQPISRPDAVGAVQDPSPETLPDVTSVDENEIDTDDTEDNLLIDEDIDVDIEDEEIPKPESREGD